MNLPDIQELPEVQNETIYQEKINKLFGRAVKMANMKLARYLLERPVGLCANIASRVEWTVSDTLLNRSRYNNPEAIETILFLLSLPEAAVPEVRETVEFVFTRYVQSNQFAIVQKIFSLPEQVQPSAQAIVTAYHWAYNARCDDIANFLRDKVHIAPDAPYNLDGLFTINITFKDPAAIDNDIENLLHDRDRDRPYCLNIWFDRVNFWNFESDLDLSEKIAVQRAALDKLFNAVQTDTNLLSMAITGVQEIPDSLGLLQQLIELRCNYNTVVEYTNTPVVLPCTIGRLHRLERLDIANGGIQQLPNIAYDELSKLNTLILGFGRNGESSFIVQSLPDTLLLAYFSGRLKIIYNEDNDELRSFIARTFTTMLQKPEECPVLPRHVASQWLVENFIHSSGYINEVAIETTKNIISSLSDHELTMHKLLQLTGTLSFDYQQYYICSNQHIWHARCGKDVSWDKNCPICEQTKFEKISLEQVVDTMLQDDIQRECTCIVCQQSYLIPISVGRSLLTSKFQLAADVIENILVQATSQDEQSYVELHKIITHIQQ